MTVTTVTARAPGKIIVLGEYAVMQGAPALVLAVDRYATATVSATKKPGMTSPGGAVAAPDVGVERATFTIAPDGAVQWDTPAHATQLALVTAVLEAGGSTLASYELNVHLDTADLMDKRGNKMGFGSSAALLVATATVLAAATDQPAPTLSDLVRLHRIFQGGRGSGFDIAAALTGGALVYQDKSAAPGGAPSPATTVAAGVDQATAVSQPGTAPSGPQAQPIPLPPDLHWRIIFTGRSGATAPLLAQVATWQQAQPQQAAYLLEQMTFAAAAGTQQLGSAAGIIAAAHRYRHLLAELGARSGADIVGEDHTELANLATDIGVFYKGCGAGGGDIGIALATDPAALEVFTTTAQKRGYMVADVAIAPQGLQLSGTPTKNGTAATDPETGADAP